jgi:ABC-type transport system substrate-binding protein
MRERWRVMLRLGLAFALVVVTVNTVPAQAQDVRPEGEMRWALYLTLPLGWLDPGEVTGIITPFWVIYALHDALVKPLPGNLMSPSLAESWTVSADQRTYEFKLREGVRFHNGDPFTADDVKVSFQRARGSKALREKVREVTAVGPHRIRFQLHEPWPDFMTLYGTLVSGAGWVVPKKYIEQVGDDGFRKHPIGLGPYRFVSHTPGVEIVMEAYEGYWRKMPRVKRLVYCPYPPYFSAAEAVSGYLGGVGIRTRLRTMERAAFVSAWASKKLRGLSVCVSALYGNAASRLSEFVPSDGMFTRGVDPDVDALYRQQARETDRKTREAQLHRLQQLLYERVRFGPLYEYIWPSAVGPRVAEPALMLIDPYPWSAPLEDVRLKGK